ncbi:MAG: sugar phosphate isomerase/epimerase [Candidatus Hydrogenedentes bacterium]|nr:sugar phosphate isomerase/epimerase [Candidatus Hydrogenedentota bacterium]
MKESLHEYIKVGLVHFMAYPTCMGGEGPIVESLSHLAQDPFFEVMEVTRAKDPHVMKQMRSIAEQAKLELVFGAQPVCLGGGLNLNHPDSAERAKAIEALKNAIDQAESLGSKSVGVLSGKVSDDKDYAKQRLVDSLKQLCAYANTKGMSVALETFDQVPFGKNCLIGPTKDAVEVSAAVRKEHANFGLMLDLSHLPLIGETSEHALKTAGEHLVHVHVGNCAMDDPKHPAYGDNHPRFGAPGTRNDVPELAEFLKVLLEMGYLSTRERKIVSFEVKPMPGESSEAIVAGSKRAVLDAWRRI